MEKIINIWKIKFNENFRRIYVYKKLRTSNEWVLCEEYENQTIDDFERIVNETERNWD